MKRTEGRLRLCTGLLIALLVFIWGNSLLPGEVSGRISQWVKDHLFPFMTPGQQTGHGLLRKLAHFTEFACLGACFLWRSKMLSKKLWVPFAASILVACIDETIQLFVPDRGPAVRDVAIDGAGAACGILALLLGNLIYTKCKMNIGGTKQ